jgi:hypothetical protein
MAAMQHAHRRVGIGVERAKCLGQLLRRRAIHCVARL